MRQRPTLPGRLQPSTIGVLRLNFCVRNGNRWNPQAITTAMGELCLPPPLYARPGYKQGLSPRQALVLLFALLHFHEAGEACTLTTVYESYVRDLFAISYWSYRIN